MKEIDFRETRLLSAQAAVSLRQRRMQFSAHDNSRTVKRTQEIECAPKGAHSMHYEKNLKQVQLVRRFQLIATLVPDSAGAIRTSSASPAITASPTPSGSWSGISLPVAAKPANPAGPAEGTA